MGDSLPLRVVQPAQEGIDLHRRLGACHVWFNGSETSGIL
jgi:hypothetical protein